MKLMVWCRWF